ncbi:MAG TPA: FtsH protease activity modulator HflK [Gammaproteobacteria bacterium]|nr:FtsH protease activity modulator HflK [Gammaproteobacteria bacterium]
MAWDDGDKGNPWRSDKDKGPADLDAVVRDLQRRLVALFRGGRGGASQGGKPALNTGLIVIGFLTLVAIWLFTGLYRIQEGERGVVLRFGAFQRLAQPGPQWHLPWPMESVEKVNVGVAKSVSYPVTLLTSDQNIVDVELTVQFKRTDAKGFQFNVHDPESVLQSLASSALGEVVGRNTLDFVLHDGRTQVAHETQDLIQAALDTYVAGVTVNDVNLKDVTLPQQVEEADQEAAKAGEEKARKILEAEAYAGDILPKARGEAEKRRQDAEAYRAEAIANAEGEADRFEQVLAQYRQSPAVTRERLYIETLEAVLGSSTKVLVDTGNGSNVLYLPLEQLTQKRSAASGGDAPAVPPVPVNGTVGPRTRERESR